MKPSIVIRLIDAVAPRGPLDFCAKAIALVATFTVFDSFVTLNTAEFQARSLAHSMAITFLIGAPFGVFVMFVMSLQRSLQEKLAQIAATDFLTGLPNRRSFLNDVGQDRLGQGVVFLIDADHFKAVNDRFGHEVGDKCLRAIGDHLRASLRKGDIVGRIGGEEFAVYLRDPTPEEAQIVAERICSRVSLDRSDTGGAAISVTVSVGAAVHLPGADLEAALRHADDALYRAKSNGRARIEWAGAIESAENAQRDIGRAMIA